MSELGYGQGYRYAHNEPGAIASGQKYFPDDIGESEYYLPTDRGLEIKISEKLKQLRQKK
jgi:putative ATPase